MRHPLTILIITPALPDSTYGNGVTSHRWAMILRDLGHEVQVARQCAATGRGECQLLIALHARKSASSVLAFREKFPMTPIVLALTGTDLYPDLASTGVDPAVPAAATRLVVLQPHALAQLDPATRERTRVIVQSVRPMASPPSRPDRLEVAFPAHLRSVKDPLLPAAATRLLPRDSRVRVVHMGAAIDPDLAAQAAAESESNPHYDWIGALPRNRALQVLARSRLMVLTSRHEGGANVLSEALAARTPVLSTAIPGSTGLLGDDYPGLFPVGDANALAALLYQAEHDHQGLYRRLAARCAALRPLVEPARERQAWADLLKELFLPSSTEPA